MSLRPRGMLLAGLVGAAALAQGACGGFGKPKALGPSLVVELKDADKVAGTRQAALPLAVNQPRPFKITVKAFTLDGDIDTDFNGFVRVSSKPGGIERFESQGADGRNLKLTKGVSAEVEISVVNAYGTTFILADDLGYQPVDPNRKPPPACANGIDDDGDNKIDFPADEGCAFANDDTEDGSTYSQGSTPPLFFALPRIADARGLTCDGATCTGGGATPYPKEPILLDTGYHTDANGASNFDFSTIVTRISASGFYLADISDTRGGFNNVFVFNFSAPPRMRVCDRIKTFAGTAAEFFGFTQISYPTWTLEEWDPQKRPCMIPEPRVIGINDINGGGLLPISGSLVRALSATGTSDVAVTAKFGPDNAPKQGKNYAPGPNATNCDLDKDGKIDFKNADEAACSNACTADPDCTEYSNFEQRGTFRLKITDVAGNVSAAIQADSSADPEFKPLEMKGKSLKAFTGVLTYFSGGAQFTIEARCKDDVVLDPSKQPLPSDKACVFPRTDLDENPE